jgi:hypothetical protein
VVFRGAGRVPSSLQGRRKGAVERAMRQCIEEVQNSDPTQGGRTVSAVLKTARAEITCTTLEGRPAIRFFVRTGE